MALNTRLALVFTLLKTLLTLNKGRKAPRRRLAWVNALQKTLAQEEKDAREAEMTKTQGDSIFDELFEQEKAKVMTMHH